MVGFDAARLNLAPLLVGVSELEQTDQTSLAVGDWNLSLARSGEHSTLYRAHPADPDEFPALAIKLYHRYDRPRASREYAVLAALYDFGVSLAPRPFYVNERPAQLDDPVLVCEWLPGKPLKAAPPVNDEEMWHRLMTMMGVPKHLPFAQYASAIPLMGTGAQTPGDVLATFDAALAQLGPDHPLYETLAGLVSTARARVAPDWNTPPKIGLSRFDLDPHHFIWDGRHLRAVGFENTDWADVAFDIGHLCAHPLYEETPPNHWVWLRWEYARLTHDDSLTARATTYTHLLWIEWAIKLTLQREQINAEHIADDAAAAQSQRITAQRDRYLERARRAFK
jgi:hypothetical protein